MEPTCGRERSCLQKAVLETVDSLVCQRWGLLHHKGRAKEERKNKTCETSQAQKKWASHMVSNRLLAHSDRKQGLETLTNILSSMALGHIRAHL